ncbi:hypothetical protein HG536_0H00900 [Torulaspora globosa]|uniref:Uncharacterized protein n=1 Tax=Torulaspora globosa TaxID=48254 RepID=A0A7G3ZMH9_9SACH|nr:uncharacterized protein HG536_0H00900 [Torulaspora globosa]QLL34715.1 hypothetical protein HG536_0H00900 [Torulaspora globosa]
MLRRKPFLCPTVRIFHLFEAGWTVSQTHRYFTCLRSAERESEDDIADWVKGSLYEPIPSQHFQVPGSNHGGFASKILHPPLKVVSEESYLKEWHARFVEADLRTVSLVLEGIRNKTMLFSLPHLMTLLRSLHSIRRYYEIHEIYCVLEDCASFIKDEDTYPNIRQEFLKIVLNAEDILGNYKLCESVFSEYIKLPTLERYSISIGLKSFLRNDNLQLAKQFFIQILENPETFPITKTEFKMFCRELSNLQDLDSMMFIFKLWVKKRCMRDGSITCCDLDYETLSLFHRLFIQSGDRKGLEEFLEHEVVKKTGYQADVVFQITEFCQSLHQIKRESSSVEDATTKKIDKFLTILEGRPIDRRHFCLSVLDALVMGDDFSSIRHVIEKVQQDKEIHLDGSFHLTIAKFFVRHGMLNQMVQYYSDIVLNRAAGRIRLKISHVEQLWDCALQAYPTLTREITNELKVILTKKQYIRAFPQLHQVLKQTSKVRKRKVMGGEEHFKSGLPQVDYERLRRFESFIASHDIASATDTALESLKRGTKPHFDFYLCAIRECLSSSLPNLAKTLSDMLSKRYKVPLKLNILWLRYDIASKYQSTISQSEMLSFRKVPLLEAQLAEFVRLHRESLNFQNYLQLSQISILIRDYNHADILISEAANLIDKRSRQQWLMYYMTALKIAARLYRADDFLALLRAWNQNGDAKLVTRGCIRQVKAYRKLFEKRADRLAAVHNASLADISKEIELLVEKHVFFKFEGLNESRKLYTLLQRWLSQEIKELLRIERKRRKTLTSTAYSDKA